MKKKIVYNIISLYGFSIAKIVFPLLVLPYLTRVLSTESYGMVAYTKSIIGYAQIFVDFGFMLSATRDIAIQRENKDKIVQICGNTIVIKLILALIAFPVLLILGLIIPIYNGHMNFLLLSYIPVIFSIFLLDFLFRGIEKMHILTIRFFMMKSVSTILTFIFVKSDADLLLVPILDVVGSFFAFILVTYELKKMKINLKITSIPDMVRMAKDSFVFFVSNLSSTIFGALNTVIIGLFLTSTDVAYWSVCMQIVTAIQTMYQPITDGIYPEMVKKKDVTLVGKMCKIFIPIILAGCVFTFFVSKYALLILGGPKYTVAEKVLRLLIPVMFFGFPSVLFGWPTLGAIGKEKEVTFSTVATAIFQLALLGVLILTSCFNITAVAFVRSLTEVFLFLIRFVMYQKYKCLFEKGVI